MSSGCHVQNIYFSTHNALGHGDDEDKVWLLVSELDGGPKQICIMVYPFYDIEMIKRLVIKGLHLPKSTNVSEIRIFYKGSELPNHRSLIPFVSERGRSKIRLQWASKETTTSIGLRQIGLRPPPHVQKLIDEIVLGFQRGVSPKLTLDGTGGTYMMFDGKRQRVAMFKPQDEEAFAPNNPRGYEGHLGQKGFRSGVTSGEGASREVAAFLLDAQYGSLAGVPQTSQVEACHPSFCYKRQKHLLPSTGRYYERKSSNALAEETQAPNGAEVFWKEGSLQEYVDANDTCGDFDPRVFPIRDAHYIGVFDLRVLNLDRNDGNILVAPRSILCKESPERYLSPEGKISKYQLIPIDHGLILPDTMDLGDIDLVWYYWPQSKIPFSESVLRHIFSLDPDRDAWKLRRKLDIREDCLRTMRVSTRVLQIGAKMRLNLQQIASLVVRKDDFEVPSVMERAVKTALIQAYTAVNASSFIQSNRLPGSILLDLHCADSAVRKSVKSTEDVDRVKDEQGKALPPPSQQQFHSSGCRCPSCGPTTSDDASGVVFARDIVSHPPNVVENGAVDQAKTQSDRHAHRLEFPSLMPVDSFWEDESLSTPWSDSSSDNNDDCQNAECDRSFPVSSTMQCHSHSVSRITGIPLTQNQPVMPSCSLPEAAARALPSDAPPCCTNNDETKAQMRLPLETPVTLPRGPPPTAATRHMGKKKTACVLPESLGMRPTTTRRRPTALPRTHRGFTVNSKSTWSLMDSNRKVIQLDWDNAILGNCFEHLIKHYILEEHPNWHSYPFNGRRVMEEFEESLSSSRQHHHHHHHSYHHRTHHRHRSSHNTQIGLTSPEYSHSRRQNETLVPLDTMKVSNPVRPTADCSSTVTLGPSHSSS